MSVTLLFMFALVGQVLETPIVDETAPVVVVDAPAASDALPELTETPIGEVTAPAVPPAQNDTVPAAPVPPVTAPAPVIEPTTTTTTATTTTTTTTTSFFADDQPGHYLAWYGAEYLGIAAVGGLYLAGVHRQIVPGPALIGPRFDLDRPDLAVLFDPRLDGVIGKPFLREQVSNTALTIGVIGVIASTSLIDLVVANDLHHTHGVLLGGAETLAGTAVVIELLKPLFGRLRPDYRDRYVHAACGGTVDVPDGLDCSTVDTSFTIDAEDLRDGSKSFASGHAATSFAMATFGSLWLGNTLVWADDAPVWGPAVGALGMGAMLTTAGWVSATRVEDNRHHVEDVVVGAGIGASVATAVFFTHFDLHGQARRRSWSVAPAVGMGVTGTGTGLAVVGALP